MASRNMPNENNSNPSQNGVVLQNPTQGINETSQSTSGSSQFNFTGIDDPEALAILMETINKMASGGSADYKAQRAERNTEIGRTRTLQGDYSKKAAFQDAADLMAMNLRQSLEKNMPAISKSIQGAGTSAGSMQGLLSQKLATESAQAAGALGAEQARSYGGISAQLSGVLEALTRIDPTLEQNLLKALELTKTSTGSTVQSQQQTSERSGGGGGGSFYQPIQKQTPAKQQLQADYGGSSGYVGSYVPQQQGQGEGYFVNESTGAGAVLTPGNAQDFQLEGYDQPQEFFSYDYGPVDETSTFDLGEYYDE